MIRQSLYVFADDAMKDWHRNASLVQAENVFRTLVGNGM